MNNYQDEKRFRFVVKGKPVPKARARVGKRGGYTPKRTKEYEKKVWATAVSARNQAHLKAHDGPVVLLLAFDQEKAVVDVVYLDESEAYSTGYPDLDNLIKSVSDALIGVAYKDDAQVVEIRAVKMSLRG